MDGVSEATLEKFIQQGFLKTLPDIFSLAQYKEEIVAMEGFGERSCTKLLQAIESSKEVKMENFLYALGIANIGLSNAKLLCRHMQYDWQKLTAATQEELLQVNGIGELIAKSFVSYFADDNNQRMVDTLLQHIAFVKEEIPEEQELIFQDKTFVVTGSLVQYENRNAIKAEIEHLGGKVAGSVSSKTDYLINNDIESNSSKNKKAKELGIPLITEEEFINMLSE